MTVRITRDIYNPAPEEYSYYPGQIIVDHPHEQQWIERGDAVAIGEITAATVAPAETAVLPRPRGRKPR